MSLTLPPRLTRRIIMQKARSHPFPLRGIGLLQLASLRFQVLFHSHSWVLFNFPSRYLCTIGRRRVFSLSRWSGLIPTRFHVSDGTWVHHRLWLLRFAYRTITLYCHSFQSVRLHNDFLTERPPCKEIRYCPTTLIEQRLQAISPISLGSSLFARRYWGNIFVFCSSRY